MRVLHDEDYEEIAKRLAERLGINASDPIEMQKDFQHLRNWRVSCETVRDQGIKTAIGVLVTGFLGGIWLLAVKFLESR